MSKNDTFATVVAEVPDVNKKLKSKNISSIYRNEVFKDIIRYKFTAHISSPILGKFRRSIFYENLINWN